MTIPTLTDEQQQRLADACGRALVLRALVEPLAVDHRALNLAVNGHHEDPATTDAELNEATKVTGLGLFWDILNATERRIGEVFYGDAFLPDEAAPDVVDLLAKLRTTDLPVPNGLGLLLRALEPDGAADLLLRFHDYIPPDVTHAYLNDPVSTPEAGS